MTYNQIISTLQNLLGSHAIIKTVINELPTRWMYKDEQPVFPVACYSVISGSLNKGGEQVYNVQFFFLDKSGAEAEFEPDVISDQWQIAEDIIQLIRGSKKEYYIDDSVTIDTISDNSEDYLAGVSFTTNITTLRAFDGCDAPTV